MSAEATMADEQQADDKDDAPVQHIGPVHHYLAVALIIVGAAAALAIAWAFQARTAAADAKALAPFDAFRAEYADRCNTPSFAGTQPDVVNNEYLRSDALRAAIDKQRAALKAGASCFDVQAALKKSDFAVPQPGSGI
jgi:hypothetical protein